MRHVLLADSMRCCIVLVDGMRGCIVCWRQSVPIFMVCVTTMLDWLYRFRHAAWRYAVAADPGLDSQPETQLPGFPLTSEPAHRLPHAPLPHITDTSQRGLILSPSADPIPY